MNKVVLSILLFGLLIGGVKAEELFYENNNGVILNESEYNKISEFYWEGYQENLTIDEYDYLKENGVFEHEIKTVELTDNSNISLFSVIEHKTSYKSLKMSTVCTSDCVVSVYLDWLILPKVRSYDLLGIYLDKGKVKEVRKLLVTSNKGKTYYTYTNKESNGAGTSFELPKDVTSLKISQTFTVENKGTIYASYQHANKSISFANSQKYSFSSNGVGKVFNFESGIKDYYDCMDGVKIKLG